MSREPEYVTLKLTSEQRESRIIPLPSNDVYDVVFCEPNNPRPQRVPTTFWRVEGMYLVIDDIPQGYPIPEEILVQCR